MTMNYRGTIVGRQSSVSAAVRRGHLLFSGEHANDDGVPHNTRGWGNTAYQLINNPNYTATNGRPKLLNVCNAGVSNATPANARFSIASAACSGARALQVPGGTMYPFLLG
jgi:iron complex outermembrane receptor protein